MEDDFLLRYRPAVRPEFAEALRKRLHRDARKREVARQALAGVAALILILGALMIVPGTRAAVLNLIREIGGMRFAECETRAACLELEASLALQETEEHELTSGIYLLESIVDDLPFDLMMPTWMPEGYTLDRNVQLTTSEDTATLDMTWQYTLCDDTTCPPIHLWVSDKLTTQVDVPQGASTEATRYARGPATYYRDLDGTSGLVWSRDDLHYRLTWTDSDLALDHARKIATSVQLAPMLVPDHDHSISLEELRAAYPSVDDFLPTWVPEGFALYDGLVHVSPTGRTAGIIWSAATTTPEEQPIAPFIGFSVWNEEGTLLAKPGTLQEVTVDGHPAALFELHAGTDEDPYYGLNWRQNGLHYSLAWPVGRVATEDVLRMAASIPENGQLPVPLDELDDYVRIWLAEQP